jgi:hypothetical protein
MKKQIHNQQKTAKILYTIQLDSFLIRHRTPAFAILTLHPLERVVRPDTTAG